VPADRDLGAALATKVVCQVEEEALGGLVFGVGNSSRGSGGVLLSPAVDKLRVSGR
jgi:hypothetical protein